MAKKKTAERRVKLTDSQFELLYENMTGAQDAVFLGEVLDAAIKKRQLRDRLAWESVRMLLGAEADEEVAIDWVNRCVFVRLREAD